MAEKGWQPLLCRGQFSLIKDIKSNTTGSLACIRDVNDRKEAEEELRRSEERYHSLVDNANDAIISTSKEGIIVSFNKKAEEMFGYTRDEIVGKAVTVLSPPRHRERQKRCLRNSAQRKGCTLLEKPRKAGGCGKTVMNFRWKVLPSL